MSSTPNRIALVTGANKGIGLEVARQLATAGCTVYLGARNLSLGQQAAASLAAEGLIVEPILLDLLDDNTAKQAATLIEQTHGYLDILVNNAGIAARPDGPPTQAVAATMRTAIETNYIGSVLVTQAMLPLLRHSAHASIVNVSSGLGSLAIVLDPSRFESKHLYLAYAASKAALNMFTVQLASELRDSNIKVNASDPGYTATDLNGNSGFQTIPEGAAETVRLALIPADGPTGTFSCTAGSNPW